MTASTACRPAPAQTHQVTALRHFPQFGGDGFSELLQLVDGDAPAAADADAGWSRVSVTMRRLHGGDTLFHQGTRADTVYIVRSGSFQVFRTAADGYEQVLGFVGRTEPLGFDAIASRRHPSAALALEESSVFSLPLSDLLAPGPRRAALDRLVILALSRALTCQSELAEVMAAVAAEVRLARFLLQFSERMAASGYSPRRFHLRMRRRDIASHLGLAHETISRSFQVLVRMGLVQVQCREVEILDPDGLHALARNTRRPVDDAVATPATLHLHSLRAAPRTADSFHPLAT